MKLLPHLKQGNIILLVRAPQLTISVMENASYRWLTFDHTVQSIMLKRKPAKLPLPHQIALCLPLLWFSPLQVSELGLGGGNLLRFIKQLNQQTHVISVEPESKVIEVFQQYFNPTDCDVELIHSSAQQFLNSSSMKLTDWLICDIYPDITALNDVLNVLSSNRKLKALSINLPNFSEENIELVLNQLAQFKQGYNIRYFEIPHYTNIIIHLVDKQISLLFNNKNKQQSDLPVYQQKRWQKLWQYGKQL